MLSWFGFGFSAVADSESREVGAGLDISAHRGDHTVFPENTLAALLAGVESGATSLEFDVVPSVDLVPFLHHDYLLKDEVYSNLEKDVDVREMTADFIKRLRFNSLPADHPDNFIPTLAQFIRLLEESRDPRVRNIVLHLEIKNDDDIVPREEYAKRIVDVLRSHRIDNRIVIRSFDWEMIAVMRQLAPEYDRILLVARSPGPTYLRLLFLPSRHIIRKFDPIQIAPHHSVVTQRLVNKWRRLGIGINPFTVNDMRTAERLVNLGVAGFATDRPSQMVEKFLHSGQTGRCEAKVLQ